VHLEDPLLFRSGLLLTTQPALPARPTSPSAMATATGFVVGAKLLVIDWS
jgi:hypothetical protein